LRDAHERAKQEHKNPLANEDFTNFDDGRAKLGVPFFITFYLMCIVSLLVNFHILLFAFKAVRYLYNFEYRVIKDYDNLGDVVCHVTTGYFDKEIDFVAFLHILTPF
jgi:hypothetical protein